MRQQSARAVRTNLGSGSWEKVAAGKAVRSRSEWHTSTPTIVSRDSSPAGAEPSKSEYAELLEIALGQAVVVFLPTQGGSVDAPSARELIPQEWARRDLPADPAGFLRVLGSKVSEETSPAVFLDAPWLAYRELEPQLQRVHGRLSFHEIALLTAAENARPGLRLAALVPYGTIAGESSRAFRAELFTRTRPELMITHDSLAAELGIHAAFRTATLVLRCGATPEPIKFFRVPAGSAPEVVGDFRRLLAMEGGATTFGFIVRDRIPPGSSLSHDLRSPEFTDLKISLEHLGELRPLTDIFDLIHPVHLGVLETMSEASPHTVAVIEGKAVRAEGLAVDLITRHTHDCGAELVRPGDVITREILSPAAQQLTVIEATSSWPKACIASSAIGLRPRNGVSPAQKRIAVEYLKSSLGLRVVRALSAGGLHTRPSLRKMLVPLADQDLDVAMRDLGAAAAEFNRWAEEAANAGSELFEALSPEEWRSKVLSAGQRVRERARAARQVDDLGFRVRSLLPHPVAYAWRVVEASRPDYDGYKAVLETSETLLLYVASLALVGARALGVDPPYLSSVADRLQSSPDRGVSMGDWFAILAEVRESRLVRRQASDMPFPEVFQLWADGEASEALNRLKTRRNDDSHGRRPEPAEMATSYHAALLDLRLLFETADFLVDYPLRLIEGTRWLPISETTAYDFRDLRGDHPLVPLESAESSTHRLESGGLYFATRREELHRVSPVLIRATCPHCGATATFCFDKLETASRAPVYRALEHRHSATRPDLADDLRLAGFLS